MMLSWQKVVLVSVALLAATMVALMGSAEAMTAIVGLSGTIVGAVLGHSMSKSTMTALGSGKGRGSITGGRAPYDKEGPDGGPF